MEREKILKLPGKDFYNIHKQHYILHEFANSSNGGTSTNCFLHWQYHSTFNLLLQILCINHRGDSFSYLNYSTQLSLFPTTWGRRKRATRCYKVPALCGVLEKSRTTWVYCMFVCNLTLHFLQEAVSTTRTCDLLITRQLLLRQGAPSLISFSKFSTFSLLAPPAISAYNSSIFPLNPSLSITASISFFITSSAFINISSMPGGAMGIIFFPLPPPPGSLILASPSGLPWPLPPRRSDFHPMFIPLPPCHMSSLESPSSP